MHPRSVPMAELMVAWMGVSVAIQQLRTMHIWLEEDSAVAINWLTQTFSQSSP